MDQAYTYLGAPYGVGGLDRSGFTSAVYADLGVYLPTTRPRGSRDPAANGTGGGNVRRRAALR